VLEVDGSFLVDRNSGTDYLIGNMAHVLPVWLSSNSWLECEGWNRRFY
jgi:hypothetical protein